MLKIIVSLLAAAIVFFIFYAVSAKAKSVKKKKRKFSVKNLDTKRKKIVITISIFMAALILLQNIVFSIILGSLYLYFSWYMEDKRRKERSALIDKQVIEALTLIKNSVQAGQALPKAIESASQDLKEPIKNEFKKISENISLGMQMDNVLDTASKSAPSKEFKLMIDTIRISKDTGSSLSSIFDRIIDTTTQRIAIQSKVKALTAQGRMSGTIVSIIPFVVVLMMYVIEPEMMSSLFTTFIGNILLLIVIIMVLIGSFAIRKLTEIDF